MMDFQKFLDIFKKLHINIPFAEALDNMPSYIKFMKDILSKKRRLGEFETVALTKECSAILQKKLPPKLKDPGSFTIPCFIGSNFNDKALCDLDASVNLMPLSIYRELDLGEVKPTPVTLQFADRSIAFSWGIIEDILVKVDKFMFTADFIVLDFEEDQEIPIILGRQFLVTSSTLIDVRKGELTMRVNDEKVAFNILHAMKCPNEPTYCFSIDIIDGLVAEEVSILKLTDVLEALIFKEAKIKEETNEVGNWMESMSYMPRDLKTFDPLEMPKKTIKPSILEASEL
ncbi:hypothetical protein MLD38_040421 [Melastoma candidum]|uniref:Uncharacterized protein n=1 Tax=Melastoma candidum TaxID=119954 RepID=A0ACB9L5V7_9MYRT|nr:hypothetical protein MLD38_040421 [Melastoma candidum]